MSGYDNEKPVHEVTVPSFEITKAEITVDQFAKCAKVDVCVFKSNDKTTKQYPEPKIWVTWEEARTYCYWQGGRFPTEAEWEFAARSRGKDHLYPWGDDEPSCDFCVMPALCEIV